MKKILVLVLSILAIQSCQQKEEPTTAAIIDNEVKARIDETLESFVTDSMVVGASALIFEKGKEAYFNAFGYADREAGTLMARNSIITIYSMTKPITGSTLMTLYEQGKFKLEDPLAKFAPEF